MKIAVSMLLASLCALSAAAEPVTVTVDRTSVIGPVKPVNGVGQPPMVGALSSWKLMPCLKEAGIPYARLHDVGGQLGRGLFVDIPNLFPDFSADENEAKNYRFDATDSLCRALEQNGVEPFFRLGVTIENFVCHGIARRHTAVPDDFAKWARICEHVIRHYTEGWADGPKMKIVHWEIWNEPENSPETAKNPMWGGTFDDFIRFYGTVAPYLKAKFPALKIGGYGSCGFYAGVGADGVKAAHSSPRTEYFVTCAERFLDAVRAKGWPLDFFSYHSYSSPAEALRQVAFADDLLNRYGFAREKTARVFDEWLPHVAHENLGSAKQAAAIAAELIGLQNGPCDIACVYDARCDVGNYSPLFDPLTYKPHKAYDAFVAFNELRRLGSAVRCVSSDPSVRAAAAAKGDKVAVMVANDSDEEKPFAVRGLSPAAVCRITDAARSHASVAVPRVLPPQSILLLSDGAANRSDWRLDGHSHIEGDLLVVDVPKGAKGGGARKTIDLTKFPKGVELHVRCRGENISKPAETWLGTKFMLHFTDGDGVEQWPGASQLSGTFDWCDLRFAKGLGKGVKGGTGELTLGLQAATGKIVFDLSTLKIVERSDLWKVPEEDRDLRCAYTESVRNAPRRRGVMLPAGACQEDDFRTLRDWGATLVRYQMCRNWSKDNDNRDLAEYDRWLDGKLDHLDREVLPWAERYGLAVVVDLHVAPGGRANSDLNMFYDKAYGDCFVACWRKIARRFKGRRNIYGYDLINEPNQQFSGVGDGDWWNLQRRAAEVVRAIDPDVTIIVESNGWDAPKTFAYLRPLRLTNVVYQAHMYQPMAFTHQGVSGANSWTPAKYPDPSKGWDKEFLRRQLAEVRAFQLAHGAKIYIGEFSAVSWAEGAERYLADCISLFEEYGWDWTYHAFREWPGWDAEKVCVENARQPEKAKFRKDPDNPRLRVLREAFASKSTSLLSATPVWPTGRTTERNLTVGFRVAFDGADASELRYSASSIARVWLNGEFLCYGPARGPHGTDRVDVIPLAGRVRDGRNVLAFEVAGYNVESFYLLNEPAYLAAEVRSRDGRVLAATKPDGPFEATVVSERVQKVPRFSYQRPFCEVYRLHPGWADWRTGGVRTTVPLAEVAGSQWIARTAPYPAYDVSRTFRLLRRGQIERRKPKKLHEGRSVTGETDPKRGYAKTEVEVQPVYGIQRLTDAKYVLYDHGLCDTGFLGAKVVCRKPGRVYFHFDEVLVDGDIDVSRMGWQCVNAVAYDFEEPGEYGIEAFEPNTFRYLKVMFDGFEGEVSDLFVRGYKNGEAGRATFESSDPALNEIFAAARETFVQNAVDVLTDCPSRERAGWLCDSFFSGRSERWLTGDNPVERCFLENFARTSFYPTKEDRFLPMCYPADAGLLPNWNFWLVFELEDHLARTGDRTLIELMRPKVEGVIDSFRKYRNADGLLEKLPGWVFIEWSEANKLVQDVNYPSNMTYAKMLEVAARLYGWTDCAEEARKVRETVRRQSWTGEWFCDNAVRQKDGTVKLSGECTETCQYYAFYFGTADAKDYPGLWNRLVADFGPKRRTTKAWPKIHPANAFVGNYLRLELLSRAGLSAQILDETKGYLHGMARRTGTLWEHDNISNSCDHGFASHAAVVLFRDMLGVRSVDPVARRIVIEVNPSLPLDNCRGTVPLSATEELCVEWRKTSAGLDVRHKAPNGWTVVKERTN